MMTDEHYQCGLTEASIAKAQVELNEDPVQRLGAVRSLRQWVLDQPHIQCETDTLFLLRFLRNAKFSQLRARQLIESYLLTLDQHPRWFRNINIQDSGIQAFIKTGFCSVLGKDDAGRTVVLYSVGNFDVNSKAFAPDDVFHTVMSFFYYHIYDEENQVNGTVHIFDVSGYSMKHQKFFSFEDMKNAIRFMQNALPARLKEFHFYNIGMFEALYKMISPLLKKKFRDRIIMHNTVETIFRHVPQKLLPLEYQPDDYTGPCVGSVSDVTERMLLEISSPDMDERISRLTSAKNYSIDLTKKVKQVQISYRKLDD